MNSAFLTPEMLIAQLERDIEKLKEELAEAHQDIKDFEELAHTWKKGWEDKEKQYKRKLGNSEKTIEQLEEDLEEARKNTGEKMF